MRVELVRNIHTVYITLQLLVVLEHYCDVVRLCQCFYKLFLLSNVKLGGVEDHSGRYLVTG